MESQARIGPQFFGKAPTLPKNADAISEPRQRGVTFCTKDAIWRWPDWMSGVAYSASKPELDRDAVPSGGSLERTPFRISSRLQALEHVLGRALQFGLKLVDHVGAAFQHVRIPGAGRRIRFAGRRSLRRRLHR
jgi:hypothetical protein